MKQKSTPKPTIQDDILYNLNRFYEVLEKCLSLQNETKKHKLKCFNGVKDSVYQYFSNKEKKFIDFYLPEFFIDIKEYCESKANLFTLGEEIEKINEKCTFKNDNKQFLCRRIKNIRIKIFNDINKTNKLL